MAPSPPAPPPAPENPYNLLPPKRLNPQYWRYASLAAFLLTCFLAPSSDSWGTILRRACWAAYWMTYLDTSYKDGSRAWPWFQRLGIWRMYCGYLQVCACKGIGRKGQTGGIVVHCRRSMTQGEWD